MVVALTQLTLPLAAVPVDVDVPFELAKGLVLAELTALVMSSDMVPYELEPCWEILAATSSLFMEPDNAAYIKGAFELVISKLDEQSGPKCLY